MNFLLCSDPESKLIPPVKKETVLKNGESESSLNPGNSFLPFLNSSSTMLNNSIISQLQPTTLMSNFKGSPTLSSPCSPITSSSTALPQLIKPPGMGFDQSGIISSSISSGVLPSFSLGVSTAPSCPITGLSESANPTLPLLTPSAQAPSNMLQENGMKNNVSSIQAAILAASRLIAVPAGSFPSTPLLSLASPLTTTAPSLTVGNGLTTYLNPNLISELLLAGGNLKGANFNIGGLSNSGIIHHELPENTTIYPVSDASKTSSDAQNSASLSDNQNSPSTTNLSLASLLPNSGTTTIGSMPFGILGVPSSLQGNNVASSISIPPTKSVQTTHQTVKDGVLPDSTIAELSAATGLPSADIAAWAAKLPSGSTVKVTRHFDTTLAGVKNKLPPSSSTFESPTANMFPIKLPDNISITATQSLLPPPPKLIAAPSKASLASMSSFTNIVAPTITSAPQQLQTNDSLPALPPYTIQKEQPNGILTEYLTNFRSSVTSSYPHEPSLNLLRAPTSFVQHIQGPISSCYTSNTSMMPSSTMPSNQSPGVSLTNESMYLENKSPINENTENHFSESQLLTSGAICLGLPSYQESFAVDPNEVLSRSCHNSILNTNPNLTNSQTCLSALEMNLNLRKRPYTQLSLDQNEPRPKVAELSTHFHDLSPSNATHNPLAFVNDENDDKMDASTLLLDNENVFSSMETKIQIPK